MKRDDDDILHSKNTEFVASKPLNCEYFFFSFIKKLQNSRMRGESTDMFLVDAQFWRLRCWKLIYKYIDINK